MEKLGRKWGRRLLRNVRRKHRVSRRISFCNDEARAVSPQVEWAHPASKWICSIVRVNLLVRACSKSSNLSSKSTWKLAKLKAIETRCPTSACNTMTHSNGRKSSRFSSIVIGSLILAPCTRSRSTCEDWHSLQMPTQSSLWSRWAQKSSRCLNFGSCSSL